MTVSETLKDNYPSVSREMLNSVFQEFVDHVNGLDGYRAFYTTECIKPQKQLNGNAVIRGGPGEVRIYVEITPLKGPGADLFRRVMYVTKGTKVLLKTSRTGTELKTCKKVRNFVLKETMRLGVMEEYDYELE
jgi:hypothetical protein